MLLVLYATTAFHFLDFLYHLFSMAFTAAPKLHCLLLAMRTLSSAFLEFRSSGTHPMPFLLARRATGALYHMHSASHQAARLTLAMIFFVLTAPWSIGGRQVTVSPHLVHIDISNNKHVFTKRSHLHERRTVEWFTMTKLHAASYR